MLKRPKLREVVRLAQCDLYCCANALDPLWNGDKEFQNRAFYPNREDQDVTLVPDLELTWWPRHVKDWKEHPHILRTLEFIRYTPRSRGRGFALGVEPLPPGRHFLLVPSYWGKQILLGEKNSADLYAWLVNHHPTMS